MNNESHQAMTLAAMLADCETNQEPVYARSPLNVRRIESRRAERGCAEDRTPRSNDELAVADRELPPFKTIRHIWGARAVKDIATPSLLVRLRSRSSESVKERLWTTCPS